MKEDSASIVSDEQSLQLDCRIIIPKFQQKDYDTYFTETSTSVCKRIMDIKTNSSEYKFKCCHDINTCQTSLHCKRKYSEDLHQNQLSLTMRDGQCQQYLQNFSPKEKKKGKKKEKSNSLYSMKSHQNPPPIEIFQLQTQLIETSSRRSQRSHSKSPVQKKSRRKLSNTSDLPAETMLESSPVRKANIQQNQIRVVQYCLDSFKDPIKQKLDFAHVYRGEQSLKDSFNQCGAIQRNYNLLINQQQPKSILKSKSCCSESSNGECTSKYKSMKSSIFKKVTFDSIKQQSMKQSKHNQQQLVIIQ